MSLREDEEIRALRREYEGIRERTRMVHGRGAITAELYYAGLNLALKEGEVAKKKKEMEEKEADAKKNKLEAETEKEKGNDEKEQKKEPNEPFDLDCIE